MVVVETVRCRDPRITFRLPRQPIAQVDAIFGVTCDVRRDADLVGDYLS
jgi:hypothetical protein